MANDLKYLQKNFTYADTSSFTIGRLPPGAYIVAIKVHVITGFNAGSNDYLDIGKTGSAAYFANDINVASAGEASVTPLKNGEVQSSNDPTTVTGIYIPAGSAPTAGAGMITIEYAYDED